MQCIRADLYEVSGLLQERHRCPCEDLALLDAGIEKPETPRCTIFATLNFSQFAINGFLLATSLLTGVHWAEGGSPWFLFLPSKGCSSPLGYD